MCYVWTGCVAHRPSGSCCLALSRALQSSGKSPNAEPRCLTAADREGPCHTEHGRVKESRSGSFSSNKAAGMFVSFCRAIIQHDELSLREASRLHVPSVVFRPAVVVWKHLIQRGKQVNTSVVPVRVPRPQPCIQVWIEESGLAMLCVKA